MVLLFEFLRGEMVLGDFYQKFVEFGERLWCIIEIVGGAVSSVAYKWYPLSFLDQVERIAAPGYMPTSGT